MPGAHLPNVLAARYASEPMVAIWSPEHKVVLERRALGGRAAGAARPRARPPAGGHRRPRRRHRQGRPRQHRGARAGHAARREGPHRGVLGAGRARAHPRRHDVARPHRERRAAAGQGGARARPRPDGRPRSPAWPSGPPSTRRSSWPAAATTSPPRPRRWASGSPTPARSCSRRSAASRSCSTRYPLRGIKGPVGTQQDMLDLLGSPANGRRARGGGGRATSASTATLANVGQVYPRSLDLDVVAALVQAGSGPASLATTIRLMAGPGAGHRGLPARPGRVVGHAPQDEQPLLRAHQRPARGAAGPPVDGRRAGRRPVERGRRVVLGRAAGRAARRLPRRRRALPDVPRRARRLRGLPGRHRPGSSSATCPFLTTTKVLMGAVRAGVGREVAHEVIKEHAVAVALEMREQGTTGNDLLDRLAADPRLAARPVGARRARRASRSSSSAPPWRRSQGVRRPGRGPWWRSTRRRPPTAPSPSSRTLPSVG